MLSRYVIYILMFAVLGAVLYAWGLKKAQSQSQELARMLYAKCSLDCEKGTEEERISSEK